MSAKVNGPDEDVTYKIIGTAMAVHNDLGPGHREEVYQKAMVARLPDAGLVVEEQVPAEVALDGGSLLTYVLDLLIERQVIVELKAVSHPVTNDDIAQVIDYLAATGLPVALLLNFGRTRLEFRRIFPPAKIAVHRRRQWTKPAVPG
ncbi:MAG TPA: GxxExxY protein [Dehalococcoidia bacterium]|nr:GxxExxY protein [Dehalococcoidia bacterium]